MCWSTRVRVLLPSGCSERGFELSVGRRWGDKARVLHLCNQTTPGTSLICSGICSVPALGWVHLPWRDI